MGTQNQKQQTHQSKTRTRRRTRRRRRIRAHRSLSRISIEAPSMADSPSESINPSSSAPQPDQLPPPPPLQQQHQQQQQQQQQQQAPLSSPFPSFPSFRAAQPQFSAVPSYMVQPPGVVGSAMNGGGAPAMASPQMMMQYQQQPNNPAAAMRHYAPMPNGYAPQGAMNHPGVPRYTSPYMPMLRPAFAPRPLGAIGMPPGVSRPLVPGARPMVPTIIRPAVIPIITPGEKPQTTVYVGKIASSVENDFMLNLLQICGLVKGWKRAEDPTTGTPKGFGFCEFASAEGVLRALRLLNKFNIDGQELMLNVNQGTKEYLERYVEKKTEISKKLKAEEDGNASSAENNESAQASAEELKKDDNQSENKETQHSANFGIVTDEDREADRVASEKIASKIEERLKSRPLPPPPPLPPAAGHPGNSNTDLPVRSSYAEMDVDTDAPKDKTDDETSDKPSEQDRAETSSPDRNRRNDRKSRDRERDLKRDKEREVDRYEKEADRERIRKERDQRRKIEDAEREYGERIKEWEYRESKREKTRQYEKEREKERERKRKREILEEEEEEDTRKRGRRSERGERRKRTLWERDEDLADRQREEEEIAEAKKNAEEELKKQEQQQNDALKLLSSRVANGSEKTIFTEEVDSESKDKNLPQDYEDVSNDHENHIGNGTADDSIMTSVTSANAPAKKLGFGLVGSGKKTAVPSVFHEEEDDEAEKDKKMRPLVPIDYSTEELQAVQPTVSGEPPSNLAAAAEFAKRISNVNSKEEKHDQERERSRRSYDRSSQRDRDRNDEDANRTKDDKKNNRDRERGVEKTKTPDNKKLLDAKQLIDMIPKTKEELFSYEINWAVYDKHELHERMRPWISKKILEFLGEEEPTLVNYIVSSTQEHVKATQMLEQLQSILDEEAEMFVLKMWRMLIFEVKKVETGLSLRPKT